jgi:hypothetical protein
MVLIAIFALLRLNANFLPNAILDTARIAIVAIIGGLIPLSYTKLTRPEIILNEPDVQIESNHEMPSNTNHLRLPVEVEGGTIRDVEAKVVNGDDAFFPRGKEQLYWAGEFIPHGDDIHSEIDDKREVIEHMAEYHLASAGALNSISPNEKSKHINIIIKVQDFPASFLANAEGDAAGKYADCHSFVSLYSSEEDSPAMFAKGKYEIDIEVNAEGTVGKLKTIKFRTGPNFDDLEVID